MTAIPKHVARKSHLTREQWLEQAAPLLGRMIKAAGYEIPRNIRYSCGFPSKGGLASKKRAIGQCWSPESSGDGTHEIFVSPTQCNPVKVLETLLHEMVHAAVGIAEGHKGNFAKCCLAMGFDRPMTSTPATPELAKTLAELATRLGPYPHAELKGRENSGPKKQGTRLIKVACTVCGCPVRMTRKWIDEVGSPACACGGEMAEDGDETDDSADE